jgi:solute carrier family 25 carnitine/acylcarnitine transporter 20/29
MKERISMATLPGEVQSLVAATPQHQMGWISSHRTTIAACTSAVVGVAFGFPLDSVKTRMQVGKFRTMGECVAHVKKTEGLMALYRGVIPTMGLVAVLRSLSFGIYHSARGWTLKTFFPLAYSSPLSGQSGMRSEDQPVGPNWSIYRGVKEIVCSTMVGGALAGFVQASVNAPNEIVKIQRQLDRVMREEVGTALGIPPRQPRQRTFMQNIRSKWIGKQSSLGAARKIVTHKGTLGLWYGFPLHAMRDVLGTILYWGTYEISKHYLTGGDMHWNRSTTLKPHEASVWATVDGKPTNATFMLSGAMAGVSTWVFAFPIDLVKSRVQKSMLSVDVIWPDLAARVPKDNPKSLKPIPHVLSARQVMAKVWKSDGLSGFYRGVGATMTRAIPIHALNFTVYEKVLAWCGARD